MGRSNNAGKNFQPVSILESTKRNITKRDKLNFDIFSPKDGSLENSDRIRGQKSALISRQGRKSSKTSKPLFLSSPQSPQA